MDCFIDFAVGAVSVALAVLAFIQMGRVDALRKRYSGGEPAPGLSDVESIVTTQQLIDNAASLGSGTDAGSGL